QGSRGTREHRVQGLRYSDRRLLGRRRLGLAVDRRDPKFAERPRHSRLHPGGEDPLQRQVRAGKILNVSAELKRAQAPLMTARDPGTGAAPVMIAIERVSMTFAGGDVAQSVQALDDVSLYGR